MKYLLFFLLFLPYESIFSQCCEFELEYILEAQDVPSLTELESCFKNQPCDPRYYYAGKMIHAMFDDDLNLVNKIFRKLVDNFEKTQDLDDIHLTLIYLYADYLEVHGQETHALAYYNFIEKSSLKKKTLAILSTLSINGINVNSPSKTIEILDILDLSNSNEFSGSDKIIIIQKASRYLTPDLKHDLFKKYKNLHKLSENEALKFLHLTKVLFRLSDDLDPETKEIKQELSSLNYSPKNTMLATNYSLAYSRMLMYQEEYNKALAQSKTNVESEIGKFDNNSSLLQNRELLEKVPRRILDDYAYMNLFQTRLGKGLPPVKDAFNIYEFAYQNRIKERIRSLNTITPERDAKNTSTPNNILVVGTYLYQKTQNIDYLNRAYTIISGMTSGGTSYWSEARTLMRNSNSFREDILEKQRLISAIIKPNNNISLKEIYANQTRLESHRKEVDSKNKDFYNRITNGFTIDFEKIQKRMQKDSTACLDFFLDGFILYRLYISPDTIDMSILDDSRDKALELTEQLTTMVESGKSSQAIEAASRELYGYLFQGIEDQLPPKLHIIANGKLLDVPFSVLRQDTVGGSPRYLGVEHAISRQFSLSTMRLLEETELNSNYNQPLAMAPAFANEFLQASELRQAGFQLPPLVYNTEELRDLESRGSGEYLYDDKATIGRYREEAEDYNIIHLATHAISSEVDGLRSRVYLLDDEGDPVGLYAGDIGEQTLNSELVVLSACETGGGGVHYVEGRVGLTKAYLAAGARSVVASNWAVDDHATAEQMKTFYDGIEAGQPPHVALQRARKAYLEAHPDASPFKWAAFEAYGGMGPVRWDKDSGASNWWWLALPVLGLGAAVGWNKRRRARRVA